MRSKKTMKIYTTVAIGRSGQICVQASAKLMALRNEPCTIKNVLTD
jgi:hypothetical protein